MAAFNPPIDTFKANTSSLVLRCNAHLCHLEQNTSMGSRISALGLGTRRIASDLILIWGNRRLDHKNTAWNSQVSEDQEYYQKQSIQEYPQDNAINNRPCGGACNFFEPQRPCQSFETGHNGRCNPKGERF